MNVTNFARRTAALALLAGTGALPASPAQAAASGPSVAPGYRAVDVVIYNGSDCSLIRTAKSTDSPGFFITVPPAYIARHAVGTGQIESEDAYETVGSVDYLTSCESGPADGVTLNLRFEAGTGIRRYSGVNEFSGFECSEATSEETAGGARIVYNLQRC
ncbi:hypothetical protein [Actinoplanes sp. HUAS TT8]|uniref:hypothetical protein n=1 Tax=Actinoplanes sp. HUAS TT8 TaxID=3447453 RepID=UPI003F521854